MKIFEMKTNRDILFSGNENNELSRVIQNYWKRISECFYRIDFMIHPVSFQTVLVVSENVE